MTRSGRRVAAWDAAADTAAAAFGAGAALVAFATIGDPNVYSTFTYLASGVEMACWYLIGQAARLPLYKLLGGAVRKKIELAACMGIRPYEEAKTIARQYVEQGFTTLKTKAIPEATTEM